MSIVILASVCTASLRLLGSYVYLLLAMVVLTVASTCSEGAVGLLWSSTVLGLALYVLLIASSSRSYCLYS